MKWCVNFPSEETVLIVRPSLVAICYGIRPAAKLLGVLLYRYSIRKEHQTDAENINDLKASQDETPDQDTTLRIFRKQWQLVADMCGEITEKTLHDVAVPMLQILGYLDIEEHLACNCYILNLDAIQAALKIYINTPKRLEKFLIEHMRLEKFLIDKKVFLSAQKDKDGLEKFPINKKNFASQLEKVLIANRKSSNCQRGRKGALEAGSEGDSEKPQISIEIDSKNSNKDIYNAPERIRMPEQYLCSGATAPSYDHVCIDKSSKPEEDERPHLTLVPPPEEEPQEEPSPAPPPEPTTTAVKPLNAEQIIQEWQACQEQPEPVTTTLRTHANTLATKDMVPGELARCKEWELTNNKTGWYEKNGIHLGNIVKKLDRFRAATAKQTSELDPLTEAPTSNPDDSDDPYNQTTPGMSKATCDFVVSEIHKHDPRIITGVDQQEDLYYIGIQIGKNWIHIDKYRDWCHLDQSWVDKAIRYGEWVLQKKMQKEKQEKEV